MFQAYDWPGNVRELKHCIDRLSAMYSEGALQVEDLPSALQYQHSARALGQLSGALHAPEPLEGLPSYQAPSPLPVVSAAAKRTRQAIGRALAATSGERGGQRGYWTSDAPLSTGK